MVNVINPIDAPGPRGPSMEDAIEMLDVVEGVESSLVGVSQILTLHASVEGDRVTEVMAETVMGKAEELGKVARWIQEGGEDARDGDAGDSSS